MTMDEWRSDLVLWISLEEKKAMIRGTKTKLVMMIMQAAPYAVFAILGKVFAELGYEAILSLAGYFFTVFGVLMFHMLVVYPVLLKLLSGLNPLTFLSKMKIPF